MVDLNENTISIYSQNLLFQTYCNNIKTVVYWALFWHYCREFEQVNANRDIAWLPKLDLTEIFSLKQMEFMKYFGKNCY